MGKEFNNKLRKGRVRGRKDGRFEVKKVRVTRSEFRRLKEEFPDSSFMAHRGKWHLMEQRMKDA